MAPGPPPPRPPAHERLWQVSGRLIARVALIAALEGVRKRERFDPEVQRRIRLGETLDGSRRMCPARPVQLPVSSGGSSPTALPAGLRVVRPGVLEVEFTHSGRPAGELVCVGEDRQRRLCCAALRYGREKISPISIVLAQTAPTPSSDLLCW